MTAKITQRAVAANFKHEEESNKSKDKLLPKNSLHEKAKDVAKCFAKIIADDFDRSLTGHCYFKCDYGLVLGTTFYPSVPFYSSSPKSLSREFLEAQIQTHFSWEFINEDEKRLREVIQCLIGDETIKILTELMKEMIKRKNLESQVSWKVSLDRPFFSTIPDGIIVGVRSKN